MEVGRVHLDRVSQSAFLTFDIISSQHFFPIRHYVPFGIYCIQHYFPSTFLPFDIMSHLVYFLSSFLCPFVVLFHLMFCLFNVFFTIQGFVCQHFFPFNILSINVFYRRGFYLDILWVNLSTNQNPDLPGPVLKPKRD